MQVCKSPFEVLQRLSLLPAAARAEPSISAVTGVILQETVCPISRAWISPTAWNAKMLHSPSKHLTVREFVLRRR